MGFGKEFDQKYLNNLIIPTDEPSGFSLRNLRLKRSFQDEASEDIVTYLVDNQWWPRYIHAVDDALIPLAAKVHTRWNGLLHDYRTDGRFFTKQNFALWSRQRRQEDEPCLLLDRVFDSSTGTAVLNAHKNGVQIYGVLGIIDPCMSDESRTTQEYLFNTNGKPIRIGALCGTTVADTLQDRWHEVVYERARLERLAQQWGSKKRSA